MRSKKHLLWPASRAACLAAAAFVGLTVLLYVLASHAYAGDSDKASTVLEGQALGEGHLLLHGWHLPLDSFWTLDQIFYAAATRVVGLRASLVHWGPAFFGALLAVTAAAVAVSGARGRGRVAGCAVVVALVAFPTPLLAQFFLGTGYHVSTVVASLLAMLALRSGRFGYSWALGCLLLALGLLGDLLTVAYAVVPALAGGLVAMLRRRDVRAGLAQTAAALTGCAIAGTVSALVRVGGGFSLSPALPVARVHQVSANLWNLLRFGADLIGLAPGLRAPVPLSFLALRLPVALGILGCLALTTRALVLAAVRGSKDGSPARRGDEPWRLDDMLVIASFGPAATFLLLSLNDGVSNARYLAPSVLFLVTLSGRVVARYWFRLASLPRLVRPIVGAATAAASVGLVGCLAYQMTGHAPVIAEDRLAAWLEAHKMQEGLGVYGAASITTVASGGAVDVRPVECCDGDRLSPMPYHASSNWYAGQRFQFLVFDPASSAGGVNLASATRTWGRPSRSYDVGSFEVLVWSRPISLAPGPVLTLPRGISRRVT